MPYPQEVNDIPAIVARKESAEAFARMIVDDFEERLRQVQSDGLPQVMGIALHPYIIGQPHRMRVLRRALATIAQSREAVWITTAGAIFNHVAALPAGTVPGCPRAAA
jgi:hypothetical protein